MCCCMNCVISNIVITARLFSNGWRAWIRNIASTAAPPTALAPFTWLTDERQQLFRLNKFLDIARTPGGENAPPAEAAQ